MYQHVFRQRSTSKLENFGEEKTEPQNGESDGITRAWLSQQDVHRSIENANNKQMKRLNR